MRLGRVRGKKGGHLDFSVAFSFFATEGLMRRRERRGELVTEKGNLIKGHTSISPSMVSFCCSRSGRSSGKLAGLRGD